MPILMATATGEQHGLINTLTNSVPFDDFKNMTPANKKKCESEKKEDSRMVQVRYLNKNGRHERLTKPYCRWSGDPIQIWHFIPNYTYEVPYGLVREVNGNKPIRRAGLIEGDKTMDGTGEPLEKDCEDDPIHQFVPINFF